MRFLDYAATSSSIRSTSFPFTNFAPAATRATSCGALIRRHRPCAASISLKAMPRAAFRDPAPRVTLVRAFTGEKVDSMGFEVRRWLQCSAGWEESNVDDSEGDR